MNTSEMATKMLEHFGPNGEKWADHAGNTEHKCCLSQCVGIITGEPHSATSQYMRATLARAIGLRDSHANLIGGWNDRQTWPTIKCLLECIRDGVPFAAVA